MSYIDKYFNYKPTYKYFYMKNNNLFDLDLPDEEILNMIFQDIDMVLRVLKLSPQKAGYLYWRDAVLLSIISEKPDLSMSIDIYPFIAKKHGKTEVAVERCMRISFEDVMFKTSKDKNLITNFLNPFLLHPHNFEIMIKLSELISSSEFKRFKYSFSY